MKTPSLLVEDSAKIINIKSHIINGKVSLRRNLLINHR